MLHDVLIYFYIDTTLVKPSAYLARLLFCYAKQPKTRPPSAVGRPASGFLD